MSFTISIHNTSLQFSADTDTSILQAALNAGLMLPYSCKDGACGTCKGKVLSGVIDHAKTPETTLPQAERETGQALFCCAHAQSDLTIECREVRTMSDIPIKKLPCRIQKLERAAPDVMIVQLRLPANDSFKFLAGQYIDFLLPEGRRRSFSIATAPGAAQFIELHIRHVPDGYLTEQVFNKWKERDILRFEGPLGSFRLHEGDAPIIFLAGGTGFAPIKSIIEECIQSNEQRPLTLYWGSRDLTGLYMHELAQSWGKALPNFKYVPVISDKLPEGWLGRSGLVHQAVMQDWPDLSGHQVYACGAPAMIDAARLDFSRQCGLPEGAFYADAFTYANDNLTA